MPNTSFIEALSHNIHYIAESVVGWFLTYLTFKIPSIGLIAITLTILNISHVVPWIQLVAGGLAILVSLVTLYKLAIELKWIKRK